MLINKSNVLPFISQLYLEKKKQNPPEDLLNSWAQLNDEEIDKNLTGLFESWGMNETDKQRIIQKFLSGQERYTQRPYTSSAQTDSRIFQNEQVNIQTKQPGQSYPQQSHYAPRKSNNRKTLLILSILIPLLIAGGYIAFKYISYNALDKVYAITQNIAIRDIEGKMVGRMDLYSDSALGSYSSLRALDNNIYYIQPEGSSKEYPSRKVIVDSVSFTDYLLNKKMDAYVNVNYLVDTRKEFDLYAHAFKEIQNNEKDNSQLKASIRKVIVGSMAITQDMEDKFLITNAEGLNKNIINNTTSIIIQPFQNDQEFVIIAPLNDGRYYRFEGNIQTDKYKPLTEISLIDENKNVVPLSGRYRFIQSEGIWRLYSTAEKSSTHFDLIKDENGKFSFFEYNPPQKISTESNLFNTVTDVINNIFN